MTLDPQNTMTEFNSNGGYGFKELGPITTSDQLSYSANLVEIVASIKYFSAEITALKKEIQVLKEKISQMSGLVYGGR